MRCTPRHRGPILRPVGARPLMAGIVWISRIELLPEFPRHSPVLSTWSTTKTRPLAPTATTAMACAVTGVVMRSAPLRASSTPGDDLHERTRPPMFICL
jgi:hypothetical protein